MTDRGVVTAGHAEKARQALEAAGVAVTLFDQVRENPTTRDVELCLEAARAAEETASSASAAAAAWTPRRAATSS